MKESTTPVKIFTCILGYALAVYLIAFFSFYVEFKENYVISFMVSSLLKYILLFAVEFVIYHINWKPEYSSFRWSFRGRKLSILICYTIIALFVYKFSEIVSVMIQYHYVPDIFGSSNVRLKSIFSIYTLLSLFLNIVQGLAYAVTFVFFVPASLGSWNTNYGEKAKFEWQSIVSGVFLVLLTLFPYLRNGFQYTSAGIPSCITNFALVMLGCALKGDCDDYLHSLVECVIMFALTYTFINWI